LIHRGHAGLMASKKIQNQGIKKMTTEFEFLGFSLNNNNNNNESVLLMCKSSDRNLIYLSSEEEEDKID